MHNKPNFSYSQSSLVKKNKIKLKNMHCKMNDRGLCRENLSLILTYNFLSILYVAYNCVVL